MWMQAFARSPAFRYSLQVFEGKFLDKPILTELVEAAVKIQKKKDSGVGLQGLRIGPHLLAWAEEFFTRSPALYRDFLKDVSPIRSDRSLL
jgi:hypothetical protein